MIWPSYLKQPFEYRPECELMPVLDDDVYAALVEDIKTNGLHSDVIVHPDGRILDGRHRLRACLDTGTPPRFTLWQGQPGSELDWVLGENLYRRHLTAGQRAVLSIHIYEKAREDGIRRRSETGAKALAAHMDGTSITDLSSTSPGVRSIDVVGSKFGISGMVVSQAYRLHERGHHDLLAQVESGERSLFNVHQEGKARENPPSEDKILELWTKTPEHVRRGWAWAYARNERELSIEDYLVSWQEEVDWLRNEESVATPILSEPEVVTQYEGPDINTTKAEREVETTIQRQAKLVQPPAPEPEPPIVNPSAGIVGILEQSATFIRRMVDAGQEIPEPVFERMCIANEAIRQSLSMVGYQPQGTVARAQQFNQGAHNNAKGKMQ